MLFTYSEENEITISKNGKIEFVENRPLLLLSSTSWTPDEDFNILLNAIIKTEEKLLEFYQQNKIRKIIFIITGI